MTTELTIGAIDPGYGGLPIGVAAALGGATLAWHAHPGQAADCPAPRVNEAYLDALPWTGTMWPTPSAYDTHLDVDAYRWARADMEGKADSRALEHWEKVTGERYPYPLYTLPTSPAPGRLSLGFVEWMMGLPIGYVSTRSLPLTRDERMGLLYSGTVPLQAAHAVAVGLAQMGEQ